MPTSEIPVVPEAALSELARSELANRRLRFLKDRVFGAVMAVGGVTVILAILTIFFYLLYVVIPLFRPAAITASGVFPLPLRDVAHLSLNEYRDTAFVVAPDGDYRFLRLTDGEVLASGHLGPPGSTPVAVHDAADGSRTVALAYADGRVLLVRAAYEVDFAENRRRVTPTLAYPLGPDPLAAVPDGMSIVGLSAEADDSGATIVALTGDQEVFVTRVTRTESLLGDEASLEQTQSHITPSDRDVSYLMLDIDQRELYLVGRDGHVSYYDIRNADEPRLIEELQVVEPGKTVTAAQFLAGGASLLIGDSAGRITQWFLVRDAENNNRLTHIREFAAFSQPVREIVPEYARKGFAALDDAGDLGLFHTTSERTLLLSRALVPGVRLAAIAPRADALVIADDQQRLHVYDVRNKHPEVSWQALWGRVWYEGRTQPEFIWQSSAATSDFEPKLSLTPLAFGTLKAAVYAMLFAIPIAVFGAVYTAYFMRPQLRVIVKPSIEIMAALPTVILGFLAGLWLAPLVESHLIGVLGATASLPPAMFVAAWAWSRLPGTLRHRVPEGSEALLLIPVVCAVVWFAMETSQPLEQLFFGGNLPRWLTQHLGITYDQRNSLVVGIAMGFAVIPNIYSISEDAVFGVPRQLSTGSLALGATPWQTVTRVVLLTASPGIFSAIMIGLGRAVGETMIVLMSTGNTPVMDFNIFQGFRALSANIAVEMPESEVNSTHYRVLFLAALVLFGVTFLFNTVAEVVRQRLRAKYGNL